MPTKQGSARRDDVLTYLTDYHAKQGFYPSVDEIAAALATTKSNIHYHLNRLEQEGIMTHTPNVARSWRRT